VNKKLDDAIVTNNPNAEIMVKALKAAVSSAGETVPFMKKSVAGGYGLLSFESVRAT
jgi:hypothetical protein